MCRKIFMVVVVYLSLFIQGCGVTTETDTNNDPAVELVRSESEAIEESATPTMLAATLVAQNEIPIQVISDTLSIEQPDSVSPSSDGDEELFDSTNGFIQNSMRLCNESNGPIPFELKGMLSERSESDIAENVTRHYLIDVSSQRQELWTTSSLESQPIGFSLNGQWYAQVWKDFSAENELYEILVVSSEGEMTTYDLDLNTFLLEGNEEGDWKWMGARWINNSHIIAIAYFITGEGSNSHIVSGRIIILNAITGSWESEILADLPEIPGDFQMYFSPDMTRVVYPVNKPAGDYALILWDIEQDMLLWEKYPFDPNGMRIYPSYNPNRELIWSPDSSYFIVGNLIQTEADPNNPLSTLSVDWDYYLVGRNGEEVDVLATGNDNLSGIGWQRSPFNTISTWSPDSQRLIMITDNVMSIYDARDNSFEALCKWANDDPNFRSSFNALWSPVQDVIIYSMQFEGERTKLYALDLETQIIYDVMELDQFSPTAWLADENWFELRLSQ